MSMKMVCNRCNKVKEDGESFSRLKYTIRNSQMNAPDESEYDLCPECSKLFSIFMDGGEVEEDRYNDSKPCAVVIHKLASGHYAIENAPNENQLHCATCAYQWDPNKCPRVKETPGTISCENHAEACDKWSPTIDKEDPDLCVKSHKVTCPTTGETITVPDGKPWSSSGETCLCSNCVHELRPGYLEPCKSCEKHSNWEPKESIF